ncbi:MAG: hypothetical protein QM783_19355 [Phycisphaerales bacterium]
MSSVPEWVWLAAGWVLAMCGVYLLALGRLRPNKKRGRLCRGCGYDMVGLGGLKCPECGRVAKSERELVKRRTGLALRAIGAVLLLAAPVATRVPEVVKHGWAGGVPDYVLAFVTPREDPWKAWLDRPGRYSLPTPIVGSTEEGASRALFAELDRRLTAREMSNGAASLYLRRVHHETLSLVDTNLRTPPFWAKLQGFVPAALEYPQDVAAGGGVGRSYLDAIVTGADEVAGKITVVIASHGYTLRTLDRKVDFSLPANELMEPVESPELNAAISDVVRPTLTIKGGDEPGVKLVVHATTGSLTLPCFARCECVVLVEGKPVAKQRFGCYPTRTSSGYADELLLTKSQANTVLAHMDAVEIELRGTLDGAAELYRFGWQHDRSGERPKAWVGNMRVKPVIQRLAEPGRKATPPKDLVEPQP